MAAEHRVAIIGCGGRGQAHWRAYRAAGGCRLVAIADVAPAAMAAFRARWDGAGPAPAEYEDYRALLREVRPEIVSVCTWPATHAAVVADAAEAGARAIFCEKPMAPTWGEAQRMAEAARRAGSLLLFCHQRRFAAPFRAARRLLRAGAIGRLLRVEATCDNLFDWGTHWFDMMHFYNDEQAAEWVLGQVDVRTGRTVFGAPVEDQGLALVQFANGVQGLLLTGAGRPWPEVNRLVGTEGVVEVQMPGSDGKWIPLRVRGVGDAAFRVPEPTAADQPGAGGPEADAVRDMLRCLEAGGEPELSAAKALRATELIFATYESSRRGARVDLPLAADGAGLVRPAAAAPPG